ncbi:MAG: nucleotidyltransferase domain-containing protein [Nitrospirota bacterium]
MERLVIRDKVKEEVKKIVERLKSNYAPEKVILFGSLADGRARSESDIDLIIIKQTKEKPWERTARVDAFISHNMPVDLLVYTPEEIEERLMMNDFFVKEVLEKGRVLYEKGL